MAHLKKNHKNGIKLESSLDLHGYTKDKAIRQMTLFIADQARKSRARGGARARARARADETNTCNTPFWIEVITGSGSHSMDGPVLREAVRSVLDVRKMHYVSMNAGSFAVNVKSGYELLPTPLPKDTKISVVSHDSDIARVGMALRRQDHHHPYSDVNNNVVNGKVRNYHPNNRNHRDSLKYSEDDESDYNGNDQDPFTPAEVKAFDDSIIKAKEISHKHYTWESRRQKYEDESFQRALEESECAYEIQCKRITKTQGEDDDLYRAIEMSKYDDYEALLEKAIKASMTENSKEVKIQSNDVGEADMIERAIEENIKYAENNGITTQSAMINESEVYHNGDEDEYNRIIEEAIKESHRLRLEQELVIDNDIQIAIKASLDALKLSNSDRNY